MIWATAIVMYFCYVVFCWKMICHLHKVNQIKIKFTKLIHVDVVSMINMIKVARNSKEKESTQVSTQKHRAKIEHCRISFVTFGR